ncbi:MAG: ribosome small subunit-dependent GTPase A [SAR324 cluster bacterium]|nr:ribosome small subunit-dependent GTPase A [SAR324 cluster bacterium]
MQSETSRYQNFWGDVITKTKGFCTVLTKDDKLVMCRVKKSMYRQDERAKQLVVGDKVLVRFSEQDKQGLIVEIATRKSIFQRGSAKDGPPRTMGANLDLVGIVLSVKQPDFKVNLLFRFLLAANLGKVKPLVIINKVDLASKLEIDKVLTIIKSADLSYLLHSIDSHSSLLKLKACFKGKRVLLVGLSGVGKTSLLNHLFPVLNLKTGEINLKISKGRHITTLARMMCLENDYQIIDTPGIKEFKPYVLNKNLIGQEFSPFSRFIGDCRIKDCQHLTEPVCGVKEAILAGKLLAEIHQSYQNIWETS